MNNFTDVNANVPNSRQVITHGGQGKSLHRKLGPKALISHLVRLARLPETQQPQEIRELSAAS